MSKLIIFLNLLFILKIYSEKGFVSRKDIKVIKESLDSLGTKVGWVKVDAEKLCDKYIREVERKELPQDITESQIVEYYNRKL